MGDFTDLGEVYFSQMASANVWSFAQQINSGARIEYVRAVDEFRMTPANSNRIYTFARKKVQGSEGRFYICDVRNLARGTAQNRVLIQAVNENL